MGHGHPEQEALPWGIKRAGIALLHRGNVRAGPQPVKADFLGSRSTAKVKSPHQAIADEDHCLFRSGNAEIG
jgi:hypothetical protein